MQIDDTRTPLTAASHLKEADGNVKCSSDGTSRPALVWNWPRVGLKVIKYRVERELAFGHGNKEALEGR